MHRARPQLGGRRAVRRRSAREHLEEQRPHGVDVRRHGRRAPRPLLGRHVRSGADRTRRRGAGEVTEVGRAEVREARRPRAVEQHVGRLDVAMEDAEPMGLPRRGEHGRCDLDRARGRQSLGAEPIGERAAGHPGQHDRGPFGHVREERQHGRVAHPREGLRLSLEALSDVAPHGAHRRREHLDGDATPHDAILGLEEARVGRHGDLADNLVATGEGAVRGSGGRRHRFGDRLSSNDSEPLHLLPRPALCHGQPEARERIREERQRLGVFGGELVDALQGAHGALV